MTTRFGNIMRRVFHQDKEVFFWKKGPRGKGGCIMRTDFHQHEKKVLLYKEISTRRRKSALEK